MDAATCFGPGNGRGVAGVDSIETRANLRRLCRFRVRVDLAFETLNQFASECGSLFVREPKRFSQHPIVQRAAEAAR
jgi:hypothetical protein